MEREIRGQLDKAKAIFMELKRIGLLLQTDRHFPNVTEMVVGEAVSGSWWGHSKGKQIYETLNTLFGREDVLVVKLLSGKVTLVHKALWPALLAVARERNRWQMEGLNEVASGLLAKLDRDEELETDWLATVGGFESKVLREAVNELEKRLLIYSEQFHTDRGKHAKRLKSWACWVDHATLEVGALAASDAQQQLMGRVAEINRKFGARARLPWGRG
ncbi:MAG: hypothetical protein DWG76_00305 [Chloroflexi bacterium]|nr:hypothetical protein [Chloroflexota bacterium]